MSISFDNALGIHEKALAFRSQRAEVLANNLANADTPNYKARDLDFSAALASAQRRNEFSMLRTSERHIAGTTTLELADPALRFRNPLHASLDQNTVDPQLEQANYAKNTIDFQASFTLLNNKFKGLMSALRGE